MAGDFAASARLILEDHQVFVAASIAGMDEDAVKAFASRHSAGRGALAHLGQLLELAADSGDPAQQQAVAQVLAEWRKRIPPQPEEAAASDGDGTGR